MRLYLFCIGGRTKSFFTKSKLLSFVFLFITQLFIENASQQKLKNNNIINNKTSTHFNVVRNNKTEH